MVDVFSITIPIFVLIGIGYAAFRTGLMEPAHVRAFGGFVLNFALPALIVRALATRRPAEIANARYLLIYGLASLAVFFLMFALMRVVRRQPQKASAIRALGSVASNSGFIGYPVAALALGAPAGVALSLNMAFENIVLIPLALALAESADGGGRSVGQTVKDTAARLARNPLILAITAGVFLSLTGIGLPGPTARAVDMLANAAGAVALCAIGGSLVGLRIDGLAGDVALVVFGKLVLHPAAVFIGLTLAPGLDPDLRKAALIFASVPMITIYPLIGQAYGEGRFSAAALVAATAASFVTISGLLYFL